MSDVASVPTLPPRLVIQVHVDVEVLDGVDVEVLIEIALLFQDGEQVVQASLGVEVDCQRFIAGTLLPFLLADSSEVFEIPNDTPSFSSALTPAYSPDTVVSLDTSRSSLSPLVMLARRSCS